MEIAEMVFRIIIWIAYFFGLYFCIFWLLFYLTNNKRLKEELSKKFTLKKPKTVTIIVPAYNEEKTIIKTLRSIISLNYPKKMLKIIVMNDGSTDDTKKVTERFIRAHKDFDIKHIYQKNSGKANALNNTLKKIDTEYFTCLDADSFVHKDALRNMMARFEAEPDLALLTPVMKVYKPKTWLQKFQRLEYMSAMLIIKLMGYIECNYVAPGPFSTYKTAYIKKIGGFDTNSLVEDQEIAYRLQERHYKIRQCSDALVYTVAPNNLKDLQKQRNRWYKGTLLTLFNYKKILFNKKYGDFGFFQMPFTLVSYFLAGLLMLSFGWFFLKPTIEKIHQLILIRFDILPYLQNMRLSINILDFDIGAGLIMYLLFAGAMILMVKSARMTQDKVSQDGKIHLIPYFMIYFIILSFIAIRVCVEVIVGKKQKW